MLHSLFNGQWRIFFGGGTLGHGSVGLMFFVCNLWRHYMVAWVTKLGFTFARFQIYGVLRNKSNMRLTQCLCYFTDMYPSRSMERLNVAVIDFSLHKESNIL